jgi:hypothetical protein
MKPVFILNAIMVSALTGCAATAPDQASSSSNTVSVSCLSEADCAEKWQRADQWIREHSYWPVKRSDHEVIETDRPRSRWYSRTRYRVVKDATSGTTAEIRMEASCQPSVYCSPNTEQARTAFVRFLQTGEDRDDLH